MSVIRVPLYEDPLFASEFKKYLLHQINSMYLEYKEIPDEVSFKGRLGKHLHTIVIDNNWNFNKTKIIHERGPNEMEIRFTRNITISKESNIPIQDSTLDGKVVDGWLNKSSQNAIIGSFSNSFNIEKTVTPFIKIPIIELK